MRWVTRGVAARRGVKIGMRKLVGILVLVAIVLGGADSARAGAPAAPNAADLTRQLDAAVVGQPAEVELVQLANVSAESAPAPAGADVQTVPPLPGSLSLFLSALLSLGAWQAVRTAADGPWAALPEWYHSGAPIQIGHTVVYDLAQPTLLVADLPAERVALERLLCISRAPLDQPRVPERTGWSRPTAPRAPPCSC